MSELRCGIVGYFKRAATQQSEDKSEQSQNECQVKSSEYWVPSLKLLIHRNLQNWYDTREFITYRQSL